MRDNRDRCDKSVAVTSCSISFADPIIVMILVGRATSVRKAPQGSTAVHEGGGMHGDTE